MHAKLRLTIFDFAFTALASLLLWLHLSPVVSPFGPSSERAWSSFGDAQDTCGLVSSVPPQQSAVSMSTFNMLSPPVSNALTRRSSVSLARFHAVGIENTRMRRMVQHTSHALPLVSGPLPRRYHHILLLVERLHTNRRFIIDLAQNHSTLCSLSFSRSPCTTAPSTARTRA